MHLTGVLLPCLVTALTIAREQSVRFCSGVDGQAGDRCNCFTVLRERDQV
ncbi:MAG: hypothetical protein AAFV85_21480 [Cyanobacteria bacterium J06634_6]